MLLQPAAQGMHTEVSAGLGDRSSFTLNPTGLGPCATGPDIEQDSEFLLQANLLAMRKLTQAIGGNNIKVCLGFIKRKYNILIGQAF